MAADDMGDISAFVPGLSVSNTSPTQAKYSIRGVSTSDFGVGTDPAVGVYVDGVYAARSGRPAGVQRRGPDRGAERAARHPVRPQQRRRRRIHHHQQAQRRIRSPPRRPAGRIRQAPLRGSGQPADQRRPGPAGQRPGEPPRRLAHR
uniref:TonB-dependent receptor plug domain-containing protein n=1 Tax=Brevundimonas sp. LF-1 TaxID=3126100 RepID=UPI00403D8F90